MPRLSVGDTAPDFTLVDQDGKSVSLSDFRGKRVVVYFYPAAMTPGCTTEACDFRDSLSALTSAGLVVLSDPDKAMMDEWGAFGEKKNYGKVVQGVIRSTVVVDAEGKVELAQYNVKATGHVARLRKALGIDAA